MAHPARFERAASTFGGDAEHGKPVEIDTLLTVTRDLGQMVGVRTPFIDGVLGLARLKATSLGLLERPAELEELHSQADRQVCVISSCD